ncbi:MAG: methyltransferase domain-containing protein [Patescibacteria group bacterium]
MIQNLGTENSAANSTTKRASGEGEAPRGTGGFLHPERTLSALDIRPGMTVADFGAGGGYFTIPAARMIGTGGKVYAIDVQKQAINLIKSRANLEHLLHVDTIWADLELPQGSRLADQSVDVVLIANILFQAEKKDVILGEAWRVLRPGGALAILEWDATPFPAGPPPESRVPKEQARTLAQTAGFTLEREFDAGDHHYGILFKK